MQAVIMEIKGDKIIVLTKDGNFKKIDKPSYKVDVGMEITISTPFYNNYRRVAAIFLVFILLSGFGASAYAYYTPYGYVNVEVNPSVEIIYNRFNKVLKVTGINQDGQELVKVMEDYKYKPIDSVVSEVVYESSLQSNTKEVEVLLTYENKMENKVEQITQKVKDAVVDKELNIYTSQAEKEEYEQTKSESENPGKAILIKKIKDNKNKKNEKNQNKNEKTKDQGQENKIDLDNEVNIEEEKEITDESLEDKSIKELIKISRDKDKEIKKNQKINEKRSNNQSYNNSRGNNKNQVNNQTKVNQEISKIKTRSINLIEEVKANGQAKESKDKANEKVNEIKDKINDKVNKVKYKNNEKANGVGPKVNGNAKGVFKNK